MMRTASKILTSLAWIRIPILVGGFAFLSNQGFALSEIFHLYDAPQALFMGGAFTAESAGYAALFHNPAGLARGERRKPEVTLLALEIASNLGVTGSAISSRSFGQYRFLDPMQRSPGQYHFLRGNLLPAFAYKGFGIALLGSYRFAGVSDGTTVDLDAGQDVGAVLGYGVNLMGNLLTLGVSVKGIARNQILGTYLHSDLSSADAMNARMKEGLGLGADFGMMLTLPMSYLPTLAFAIRDITNTQFQSSRLLNPVASGIPDPIAQSTYFGFSMQPRFSRNFRTALTADLKHLERTDIALLRRLHVGMQLEWNNSFFTWFGLNQMLPTFGLGMRVAGGNLEIGGYGVDIGPPSAAAADTRFLMRYTIGF